nr:hypothetical protein [uncultured Acetatifactor sp.]
MNGASEWGWWGKTDQDRIIQVLQGLNPEEAERAKQKREELAGVPGRDSGEGSEC